MNCYKDIINKIIWKTIIANILIPILYATYTRLILLGRYNITKFN